jgi:hypothetical protein
MPVYTVLLTGNAVASGTLSWCTYLNCRLGEHETSYVTEGFQGSYITTARTEFSPSLLTPPLNRDPIHRFSLNR